MKPFHNIILRNRTGSNVQTTANSAKNVMCVEMHYIWVTDLDTVWTVSKNILKCCIDKLYGHFV